MARSRFRRWWMFAAALVAVAAASCTQSGTVIPAPIDASTEPMDDDTDAAADAPDAARGCPGTTPASYPWSPPVSPAHACSDEELASLAKGVADKTIRNDKDIAAALGPACAACAVGRVTDTSWRAILGGHVGYIGNVGGCVMLLGGDEACGRATDEISTCLIVGCAGCADRRAQDRCADDLTTVDGACAKALETMRDACPNRLVSQVFGSSGTCQSIVETIRLFCGPTPSDAGHD